MQSNASVASWLRRIVRLAVVPMIVTSTGVYADGSSIVGAPLDLKAAVHEALLPGGTLFDDNHALTGAGTTPKQSIQYLFEPTNFGLNLSGRSTSIQSAFASSLAESDGNGGVGVSAWVAGRPGGSANPGGSTGQLAATATWAQSFTYNGAGDASLSMTLHIPQMQVGLIGVAPNRSGISATETAFAQVMLNSVITHADGSSNKGGSFLFGMREFEQQIPLGPGTFANFANLGFLGSATTLGTLNQNGDPFNPTWFFDPFTASVKLGTLTSGDTVSYVYTLTAEGTTLGGEHGFYAFVGDPFGVDVVTGNLLPELTAAVPEPATGALTLLGLGGLLVWRRRAPHLS